MLTELHDERDNKMLIWGSTYNYARKVQLHWEKLRNHTDSRLNIKFVVLYPSEEGVLVDRKSVV